MTDFTTATPISIRRPSFRGFALPKLGLAAALARFAATINNAYEVALVMPHAVAPRQPRFISDEVEDGRDPNW